MNIIALILLTLVGIAIIVLLLSFFPKVMNVVIVLGLCWGLSLMGIYTLLHTKQAKRFEEIQEKLSSIENSEDVQRYLKTLDEDDTVQYKITSLESARVQVKVTVKETLPYSNVYLINTKIMYSK